MTIELRLNALQTGLTIDAYETHLTMLDRAADMEASFGNDEKAAEFEQQATEVRWLVNRLREARANDRDPAMRVQVVSHAAA